MRILSLLMIASAIGAQAQTPQELLRLAQEAYKNPTGYEIRGKGAYQPAGSSWKISFTVRINAAPAPLDSPNAPVNPSSGAGGPVQFTKVGDGADEKPTSILYPAVVVSGWSRIAENVASAKELDPERLELNGALLKCRVIEATYGPSSDGTTLAPAKYSICGDQHLVLKKAMFYSTGRRPTDSGVEWTLTFDTAEFHRPAPQWLINLKNHPAFSERQNGSVSLRPTFDSLTLMVRKWRCQI